MCLPISPPGQEDDSRMNVIFDQTRSFCQLTLAIFFLCYGCSSNNIVEDTSLGVVPVYNGLQPKTSETDLEGFFETHQFFDPAPFAHPEDKSLNVVVLTPEGSQHAYELDTRSGTLYRKRYQCEHKDIWGKYEGTLSTPPFSISVIPRTLDALGEPQKAFVFGAGKYFEQPAYGLLAHRVRVVGGVVRQECRDYPCTSRERWLSNMQFIAVNTEDPVFRDVHDLASLKAKVNWEESLAWMQNGFGITLAGAKPEPVYRIAGEIDAKRALSYFFKKNTQITFEEQKSISKSCNILYEDLWQGSLNIRAAIEKRKKMLSSGKEGTKELLVEYSELEKLNLTRESRRADEINKRYEVEKSRSDYDFAKFFSNFHENYGKRYKTCMRFVRPASIAKDQERFWFFAFIDLFMGLEDLGWSYRCSRRGWIENPKKSNGKRLYKDVFEKNCTINELDLAFDMAITVMAGEKAAKRPHLRFIGYDSGANGSHKKIYGWVYENGKELVCTDEDEIKLLSKDRTILFPGNASWKSFRIEEKRSRYDIIK